MVRILGGVGLGPFGFFEEPNQAMITLVLMTVWGTLGFDAIIHTIVALRAAAFLTDESGSRHPVVSR